MERPGRKTEKQQARRGNTGSYNLTCVSFMLARLSRARTLRRRRDRGIFSGRDSWECSPSRALKD